MLRRSIGEELMTGGKRVVYVGREAVFRGLTGTLVERQDRTTNQFCLHFQPDSEGIMALPCNHDDVLIATCAGDRQDV